MFNNIDNIDIKILKALHKNARASLREIASTSEVAVGTVQNRLNKLRRLGVLLGFEPRTDYNKLGFNLDAIIALQVKRDRMKDMMKILHEKRNIMSIYEVTGDVDMFLRVQFKDAEELRDFLINDLSDEYVKNTITYIVMNKTYKQDLLDELGKEY